MNSTPQRVELMPDVQGAVDHRSIRIDEVGVRAIRHPIEFVDRDCAPQATIAMFDMFVSLDAAQKGAHMSRFVAILNDRVERLSVSSMGDLLEHTTERLEAHEARIRAAFTFFVRKRAPVTGVTSLLDYDVVLDGHIAEGPAAITLEVVVPVTSLCPCSKEISDYGAHNQRSHVTIRAEVLDTSLHVRDIIDRVEAQASSELFGLLKRPDEKAVTERAYDNPKFVEDMIRDVAVSLREEPRIGSFEVICENFESIHNHSAFARLRVER